MLDDNSHFHYLAESLIKETGNPSPKKSQIKLMQSILEEVTIVRHFEIDQRLNEDEANCLYLTALGKTEKEIASITNKNIKTIKILKTSILTKLQANNDAHAVYKGIRYGCISGVTNHFPVV